MYKWFEFFASSKQNICFWTYLKRKLHKGFLVKSNKNQQELVLLFLNQSHTSSSMWKHTDKPCKDQRGTFDTLSLFMHLLAHVTILGNSVSILKFPRVCRHETKYREVFEPHLSIQNFHLQRKAYLQVFLPKFCRSLYEFLLGCLLLLSLCSPSFSSYITNLGKYESKNNTSNKLKFLP